MRYVVVALSALLAAAPAAAQTVSNGGSGTASNGSAPQASTQATGSETAEPAERRICRRIETVANRTAARRVCMTQREWRDYDRNPAE